MTGQSGVFPPLSESPGGRILVFSSLYVAQGVSIGLMLVALPAWLAERGRGPGEVASYVAIVTLPWALKVFAGPFMDRFQFRPMGARRPWVMGAQAALVVALLVLSSLTDPVAQLNQLLVIGFAVSCCAATQDVAVDGMAVDVIPQGERARVNAFMAFGQVLGSTSFGALSGHLIVNYGTPTAARFGAAIVALIFLMTMLTQERPGERLLPWTTGAALTRPPSGSKVVWSMLRDMCRVILLPMSLLLVSFELIGQVANGLVEAATPILGINVLGFATDEYTRASSVVMGVAALLGVAFGPVIDRFGGRPILAIAKIGMGLTLIVFALTVPYWSATMYVVGVWFTLSLFNQIIFIAVIAQFMDLSWVRVAATQFAIYMALSNLGASAGAATYSAFAERIELSTAFLFAGTVLIVSTLLLIPFNVSRHVEQVARLESGGIVDTTRHAPT